jgi:hypothetical protein
MDKNKYVNKLATTLSFVNHLPEDGHCRLKYVGGMSCNYKYLSSHYCEAVGRNMVD